MNCITANAVPKMPKIAAGHVAALQLQDELREHRDDDAEGDHVEQDRDEDEDERGPLTCDHRRIMPDARGGSYVARDTHRRRLVFSARSPSGLGRFPFKEEVMGSNPIRATEFIRELATFS
jgi:hypothetical protein